MASARNNINILSSDVEGQRFIKKIGGANVIIATSPSEAIQFINRLISGN